MAKKEDYSYEIFPHLCTVSFMLVCFLCVTKQQMLVQFFRVLQ